MLLQVMVRYLLNCFLVVIGHFQELSLCSEGFLLPFNGEL